MANLNNGSTNGELQQYTPNESFENFLMNNDITNYQHQQMHQIKHSNMVTQYIATEIAKMKENEAACNELHQNLNAQDSATQ